MNDSVAAGPVAPSDTSTPVCPTAWLGEAQLVYAQHQGQTTAARTYAKAPLRLQQPLYPEGPAVCHSVLVHTAGGMVGGDRLSLDLHLGPGSRALITTAAAHKVYRSAGAAAHQTSRMTLAPGSCLEWFPQETIVFNGAIFQQSIRVDLAADACWVGWDITRFGRSARGETFQQGHWRSRLEIWRSRQPLWIDRPYLRGGSEGLTSPHGLAGYPVVGTFALVGLALEREQVEALRGVRSPDPGDIGITRLQAGLLCRYRGPSSQAARQWFGAIWAVLRPWYLDRPANFPRVWAI